ncbi:MAG: glycogen/starch/alpha-glucan phosphorylase [Ruminococcaceae bacterium]|nr:glycogen/starch/alpha-glucan phosphorylase [Oscillospiraceae bacterium]
MGNQENKNPYTGEKSKITKIELKERIEAKLVTRGVYDPSEATEEQLYVATVHAIKDIMLEYRSSFRKRVRAVDGKRICYLCMEFLVGRSLKNVSMNLGIYSNLCEILTEFGSTFEKVYACEVDPGLGNGGLGRLAACFMDSLAAQDYAANGYSLLYENGLFKQKIIDGEQVELPDSWLSSGGTWLVPRPEKSVTVRFGGRIEEKWENGELKFVNYDYDEVKAVPYDLLIPGTVTDAVNNICLWRARQAYSPMMHYTSQSSYLRDLSNSNNAEIITQQLYPNDNYDEGKLLRLTQQYFLVSASLQSIISDYFAEHGSLKGFEDKISLHINDTHPALCIPELMRILMDVYSYSWDDAWAIVVKTVSYTNHTVLPEALECWRVDLFSMKLPRIFMIVNEINRRFTADLWNLYPGDWDRISRMAIVAYNQVRMANLSVVGSHTVNGVSQLHSDILKKTIFKDFYKMTPWKFTNVTNGVVHRRWLNYANPGLCKLLDELIGTAYREDASELIKLEAFKDDASVLKRIEDIKHYNKETFAYYVYQKTGKRLDPTSIFDVQIKRMHEYKRQLLNVLKIISLYNEILENPNADIPPQTFIFGCKAAPGYAMAKKLIKLIWFLSEELERNPLTRDRLKVVFMEEYNVSLAEVLIPSADISEQISLAGKEASGTGCMKLMMNGALTMGTLDGANVEILAATGRENIYIFGLNTPEVEELWRNGYVSRDYYHRSDKLKRVVDRFNKPIGGQDFSHISDYLINGGYGVADPFMCLADFDSYCYAYGKAIKDYGDRAMWSRMSLMNTATSGVFASDNSISKYANDIWHADPIYKAKK